MGDVLEGTNKPFIVTSGTGLVAPGVVVTEEMRRESSAHVPRVSEQAGLAYASRGVRAMAIRLPQVHGADGKAGLISYLVELARKKGAAAYVGDGTERWAAAHRQDVARLYRLALENGVGRRDLPCRRRGRRADAPGDRRDRPRVGRAGGLDQEGRGRRDYYGPLAMFAGLDMPASSALTQQRLGWTPTGIGLIADIGQPGYFKV